MDESVSTLSEREDATLKHTPTTSDTHTCSRKGWGFIRSHTPLRAHSCDGNVSYGATSPPLKPLICVEEWSLSLTHSLSLSVALRYLMVGIDDWI